MRVINQGVFDEYVPAANGIANAVFTAAQYNSMLGQCDQATWQLVVDNTTWGTGTKISARLQHSADGRNWIDKTASGAGDAEVNNPGNPYAVGFDAGTTPMLGFCRLAIFFNAANTASHVKVFVTCRDSGR